MSLPATPALQRAILQGALCLAVGGGLLTAALHQRQQLGTALERVRHTLEDTGARSRSLATDIDEIRHDATTYAALEANGTIAPELRDHWLETLHAIATERRIDDLDATFGARRRLASPAAGLPTLMATTVRLRWSARHEPDLLNALDAFSGSADVVVRKCTVSRQTDASSPAHPGLKVACDIDRLSFEPPDAGMP